MCNKVIPAIRNMKDFELALKSDHQQIILLESRLSQVENVVKHAKKHGKEVFMHADLIQGLKVDEYGLEYLINNVKVNGIISTRSSVISFVKKRNIVGIQRLFALDSVALDHNLHACQKIQPDYIEVLPGVIPEVLQEVKEKTGIKVIAGGLIKTQKDVDRALAHGASVVTTSNTNLW